MSHCYKYILLTTILLFFYGAAWPDTLILKNETVLVGKVKKKQENSIIFKNSYGAFVVKRDLISKLYETNSYREDIAIRKKLGLNFNAGDIRKNYREGTKKLTKSEEKRLVVSRGKETVKAEKFNSIRIEPIFTYTLGELNSSIPYGYGALLSYSRSFETVSILSLFFKGGYIYHSSDPYELAVSTAAAGPGFTLPLTRSGKNLLTGAVTAGASYMNISNETEEATTWSFTTITHIGYEYSFQSFGTFINIFHLYVYDKDVFFHSLGVSAGLNIKF